MILKTQPQGQRRKAFCWKWHQCLEEDEETARSRNGEVSGPQREMHHKDPKMEWPGWVCHANARGGGGIRPVENKGQKRDWKRYQQMSQMKRR